jgi:hypothetical protein
VIFVRTDDAANVGATVGLHANAARPEPSRLDQNLATSVEHELVIAGDAPVLPDPVGDVGADVVLLFAGQDANDAAIRHDCGARGCFLTGLRRLSGVQRALIAMRLGLPAGGAKRVMAIHQEAACHWWIREHVEGQHVDLGVPKDVPAIAFAREATGAD